MDFSKFLQTNSEVINLRLEEILEDNRTDFRKISLKVSQIFEKFIESCRGGKRVRGALVLLGFEIAGGVGLKKVIDGATAYEIFQTSILAQDDVIDESLSRRNRPSLYKALGGDHKAISETICMTDLGIFLSFRLLSTLKIEDSVKTKAVNLFSQTLMQTVLGEMLDIEAPFAEGDFLEDEVIKLGLLKTARYSITGPLMLGATLAGADLELLKKLQEFGDKAGIAFQIQDDILGVFGDEKITGKSVQSDIKECKATVLIAYAQLKGSKDQKEILGKYYGNREIDAHGVEKVREIFIETGALDYAKKKAEAYFEMARESLNGDKRGLLYSLIDYLKGRIS